MAKLDGIELSAKDFGDIFCDRLDSFQLTPSRAWDAIELNLHHDYLDIKRARVGQSLTDLDMRKMSKIARAKRSAGRARLAGEDPLHWKLSYKDGQDDDT